MKGGPQKIIFILLVCLEGLHVSQSFTHPDDYKAIYDLYYSTQGEHWTEGFSWQKGVARDLDPCDSPEWFKGLSCHGTLLDPNRKVKSLLLSFLNLNGTLPSTFGLMTEIEEVFMTENTLYGPIPESVCNFTTIRTFDAARNRLNGTIPQCVANMKMLFKIDLRSNELTGPIPPGFGNIQELQELYLSENDLSGPIPPELYNARRLEVLFLSYNKLTGIVPRLWSRFKMKETPAMTGLSWLDIRSNDLGGTYPEIVSDFGAV